METGRFQKDNLFGYHWGNLENEAIFKWGALRFSSVNTARRRIIYSPWIFRMQGNMALFLKSVKSPFVDFP